MLRTALPRNTHLPSTRRKDVDIKFISRTTYDWPSKSTRSPTLR